MVATKRVFISFDYDHDNDLRGNLVAQAEKPESPFRIADESLREPIDENWRKEVRARIRRADLVFVICGEHTHDADWCRSRSWHMPVMYAPRTSC